MLTVLTGCLQLLVLTGFGFHSDAAVVTCVAGEVVVGETASITCNFRTSVTATKRSINIARYPSNAPKGTIGSDVLLCNWQHGKYDCIVEPGYTFDYDITSRLTVRVPKASEKFAGMYMCFFVPQNKTEVYPCELLVKAKQLNYDTDVPPQTDDTPTTAVAVAFSLILLVLLIFAVLFICWRRRKDKKRGKKATDSEAPLIAPMDIQIQKLLKGFELHKRNLEPSLKKPWKPKEREKSKKHSVHLMDILDQELKQGLDNVSRSAEDNTTRSDENNITRSKADDVTPSKAALQMYRTCCHLLNPSRNSDFLVVDWSCACFKISLVKQRSHGAFITSKSYTIRPEMKTGRGNKIFDLIAESINTCLCDKKLAGETHNAVLILPFPCHQTSLKKARLAKWTREFCCEDVVDKDIQELLQNALQRKKTPCKVNTKAILNDAVSTLVSVAYKTPECKIALTVGSGFNACFVETWAHEGTSITNNGLQEQVIYNTELGALGENGCLTEFRTDFDRELDDSSRIPGSQLFEKMVSWTYIGDIVRLALRRLRKDNLLLPSEELGSTLFQKGYITSDRVAEIHSDTESPYQKTKDILTELEVTQCTEEDMKTIRYVCGLVCDRAIYLTSAALATLINHLKQPGVMVVVDGELNKKLPRFGEILYSTTNKLVNPELKDKFFLVSSNGRQNLGAALIAAASMRHAQAAASSHSSLEKTHC